MANRYGIAFARRWAYLMVSLFVLFSLSGLAMADTTILDGMEGDTQALIDQLSKRLTAEPHRAELYYHLACAYDRQGWDDKAAQYMNQWIEVSNSDVFMKGDHVFMMDEKNDRIMAIDKATRKIVRKIDVGWSPRSMISIPHGDQLYVTNALANTVSVINTRELSVTDTIKVGRMPWNGKSSPEGDRVYVTNLKSNDISVIDVASNSVLETVKVGGGPWGIAVSPDGHTVYVSNQNSQNIQVIDTGSYNIVDVISVGSHPRDIALAPGDENKLYALDKDIASDEVEIYVVDLGNPQIMRALGVPSIDDPVLSRLDQMSLDDKLALLIGSDRPEKKKPEEKVVKRVPKPRLRGIPALMAIERSEDRPFRPVTDRKPEAVRLPMGGPMSLTGPEPLLRAYVKVPVVSSGKPLPLQEVEQEPEQKPVESVIVVTVPVGTPAPKEIFKHERTFEQKSAPKHAETPQSMKVPEQEETPKQKEASRQEKIVKQKKQPLKIIIVVKRNTLWKLALDNYGKVDSDVIAAIQDANPEIKDPDKIYVGQQIQLPALNTCKMFEGKSVRVKPNDSLYRIALKNYGIVDEKIYAEIQRANPRIKNINLIEVGQRIVLPTIDDIPLKEA